MSQTPRENTVSTTHSGNGGSHHFHSLFNFLHYILGIGAYPAGYQIYIQDTEQLF